MSNSTEPEKTRPVRGPETKSVTEAVKELRIQLGETQQSLATKLKIAISTMVRYETNRPPRGEALVRFMKLAGENNLVELERIFQSALEAELGHGVMRVIAPDRDIGLAKGEEEEVGLLLRMLRQEGGIYEKARVKWKRISEPIRHYRDTVKAMEKLIEDHSRIRSEAPSHRIPARPLRIESQPHINLPDYLPDVERMVDAGHTDAQILAAIPGANIDVIRVARHYADTRRMGSIFEEKK